MITGIGTDIIELSRVRRIVESPAGERFFKRILTPSEQALANARHTRQLEFVAGRFSAKEAVAKALGCGIGNKVGFQDIEILPDPAGKPVCRLSEEAAERLGLGHQLKIHVSISHSESAAVSFALAEL